MEIVQKIYSHYEFKKLDIEIIDADISNKSFIKGVMKGFIPPIIIHLTLNSTEYKYSFLNNTKLPFMSLMNYIDGRYDVDGEYFNDLHPSIQRKLTTYQFQFNIIVFAKDEEIKDIIDFFNCSIF